MKNIKKTLILALAILFLVNTKAYAKEALGKRNQIELDREIVEIMSYNIDGYNYFKLRDIASAMRDTLSSFDVYFDKETSTVEIFKDKIYVNTSDTGNPIYNKANAIKSEQTVRVDGVKTDIDAYLIEDNNYFKLRDLGKALNFFVDYDEATKTIIIDSSKSSVDEKPQFNRAESLELDKGFYIFNSAVGGKINLPKGVFIVCKNDILQTAEIVKGEVNIPKEGYCFYQRTDEAERYINDYILNAPVGVLLTMPIEIEGVDNNINTSIVAGFSFMGDKETYVESYIDIDMLIEFYEEGMISLYQGNTNLIFKEIDKGRRIGDLYWFFSEFEGLDLQKEAMIAAAKNLINTPYSSLDCSGLVATAMDCAGIYRDSVLYTWTIDYSDAFEIVPMSQLKRGDILSKSGENGHMMIYLGNGKVIESLPKTGVIINNVRKDGYKVYRIKDYNY
ncbi:MAG: NlpC/P60 family protein [Tissierellia bacterium]|nr:NlpC/P60 family protein [Tissierellia bacterium]